MVASWMELVLHEEVGGGEDLRVKERKLERNKHSLSFEQLGTAVTKRLLIKLLTRANQVQFQQNSPRLSYLGKRSKDGGYG